MPMLTEAELAAIRADVLANIHTYTAAGLTTRGEEYRLLCHIDALTAALAEARSSLDIQRAANVELQQQRDTFRDEREYEIEQQEKVTAALAAERAVWNETLITHAYEKRKLIESRAAFSAALAALVAAGDMLADAVADDWHEWDLAAIPHRVQEWRAARRENG